MPLQMRAIVPTHPLINTVGLESKLKAELDIFASEAVKDLKTYPSQLSESKPVYGKARHKYKTRPAGRRVLRSGYKRTGTLGRSWSWIPAVRVGNELIAKIGSSGNVAPYNVHVQHGPTQTRDMKRRNWPTDTSIMRSLWPKAKARVMQVIWASRG